jgi:CRP-like cAMP-binding protein
MEAMMQQAIVCGNRELAAELIARAELLSVPEGDAIITQGGSDNDLFLIIAGSFKIIVNGREVAMRGRGCQSAFNRDPLSARKRDPLAEMLGG